MNIKLLHPEEDEDLFPHLSDLVLEAVEDGASVEFLDDFTRADAVRYWSTQRLNITAGRRAVLAALQANEVVGTISLCLDKPPNQPHAATLKTMMVRRNQQRRGIGSALLAVAEAEARRLDRWLLLMDTVSGGPAGRLFERAGWEKVGDIPAMRMMPHGGLAPSTLYFKRLSLLSNQAVA